MQEEVRKIWKLAGSLPDHKKKFTLWLECLGFALTEDAVIEFYRELTKSTQLHWREKYFLYWQVFGKLFTKSGLHTQGVLQNLFLAYHSIEEEFLKSMPELEKLSDRNPKLVMVTTQQFLSLSHAPTKATMERAVMLAVMGKQVVVVNTAETYGGRYEDVQRALTPNYNTGLNGAEYITYQGIDIPFLQFPPGMPDAQNAELFYQYVRELKPSYIVNIGANSLMVDGCTAMIPVLNINTVAAEVACTHATRQVMGRPVTREDKSLLRCIGKSAEDVLVGRFTFELKPQEHVYRRDMLGIPEDAFVLTVVGNRLAEELDEAFWAMLTECLKQGAFLAIIGELSSYEALCNKYEVLKCSSRLLGVQEDLQAAMECCNLYVNPRRLGGGTSALYALHKGIPLVTWNEGDVSLGAGKVFCVKDYTHMQREIIRYMHDEEYYSQMSQKARERAEYMLDSQSAFSELIGEFERTLGE